MPERSPTLAALSKENRSALERRLHQRQSGRCFICDQPIDLDLLQGQVEIDHIVPLAERGPDEENNFALTHGPCNRQKGSADLRVARRMAEFERLQDVAREQGLRGVNLGHLLARYGGGTALLRLRLNDSRAEFVLTESNETNVTSLQLHKDGLSGMQYFFAMLPLAYLHHDDRINPRSIGSNIRGLIEEFMKKRPQLHIALAWWAPTETDVGPVKVFDGQHKAAAQILLGVKELPVRVFVKPDTNVLLQANTNAGDKLRQVAFDVAVLRHLGSTLYAERVRQFQAIKGRREDDFSFSERDLVTFFRGERREVLRYVVDAARDAITYNKDNRLMEFVEWAGKAGDRPLAYSAVERTFFSQFLFKNALDTPIGEGVDRGENPRFVERHQLVKFMSLFANVFFVGHWDPELGGNKLENRLQKGDSIPEPHLRAWRVAREEILGNILLWVRLVIENYFAWGGQQVDKDRLFHTPFPEPLWQRVEAFLKRLGTLPCWVDKNLSITVFGAKQNLDFWRTIFKTGKAPSGVQVLAKPLDITEMIQGS